MALNLVVLIMSIFKNSMPKYQKYMWGHIRGVRKMGSRGLMCSLIPEICRL